MGGEYKRSSRFVLDRAGTATDLVAYLDGLGAGMGAQQIRYALYADAQGEPGTLIGQTTGGTVASGAAAGWVSLPLERAVALGAAAYHLAILSGATGAVARYSRGALADGLRSTGDAFADGASGTYGAAAPDNFQVAIFALLNTTASPPPPAAPSNTAPPTISGTAKAGQTLVATPGQWTGSPDNIAYQWQRCESTGSNCAPVSGAMSQSYGVGAGDVGATIRVRVTAFNSGGSSSATSAPTAVVSALLDVCDRYASSLGLDTNLGTALLPFRTVAKLLSTLGWGQVGCLVGTFNESVTISTAGVTLASAPGQRAKINGGIRLNVTANGATVRDLDVDGYGFVYSTFRIIGADQVSVINMDITNRNYRNGTSNYNAICLLAGAGATFESDPSYTVWDLLIERSRIHNCGDDAHEHSIYLETTRNAVVRDNYLYGNSGYGVTMYPDAQSSTIEHNVIDANSRANRANLTFSGEAAGGEYSKAHGSDNNTVRYNIISNAVTRYNVDSYYPSGSIAPRNNRVDSNCVWNAPSGNFGGTDAYSQTNNKDVDPTYVNAAAGDYSLHTTSPCAGWGPRVPPAN
jgi:hypothetical protein